MSSYVLAFNGRLGQLVQDHELQRLQLLQTEPAPGLKAGPLAKAEGDHEQLAAMGARGESLDISVGTGVVASSCGGLACLYCGPWASWLRAGFCDSRRFGVEVVMTWFWSGIEAALRW